jgi:hypothetical protein
LNSIKQLYPDGPAAVTLSVGSFNVLSAQTTQSQLIRNFQCKVEYLDPTLFTATAFKGDSPTCGKVTTGYAVYAVYAVGLYMCYVNEIRIININEHIYSTM